MRPCWLWSQETRGSGDGPISRVLSRVVISLGCRLPGTSSDRPGSHSGSNRSDKAPCLILLPVGFTKPSRSPGPLVRSYRTVSPLPPGAQSSPRSAVYSLWHCPYPRGRWVLPTTVSLGARTFLHALWLVRAFDAATTRPTPTPPLPIIIRRCPLRSNPRGRPVWAGVWGQAPAYVGEPVPGASPPPGWLRCRTSRYARNVAALHRAGCQENSAG